MKTVLGSGLTLLAGVIGLYAAFQQPPGDRPRERPDAPPPARGERPRERPGDGPARRPGHPIIEALDLDKDGILSAEEIRKAPESLLKLDRNKDGQLTPDELRAPEPRRDGGRRPDEGQPRRRPEGDDRRPDSRRPERPRPDDRAADGRRPDNPPPPRPGEVLPRPLQERLQLTAEQRQQIEALEKEVRARLEKILTAEQREQLQRMPPPRRDGPGDRRERPRPPDDERDEVRLERHRPARS